MRRLMRRGCGSGWAVTGLLMAAGVVGSLLATRSQAAVFTLPPAGGSLIGQDQQVQSTSSDTLLGIARRYSVGYWEIQEANPKVHMWLPGPDTRITIPGRFIVPPVPHRGIVVNLPQHRQAGAARAANRRHLPGQPGREGLGDASRRHSHHPQGAAPGLDPDTLDPEGAREGG